MKLIFKSWGFFIRSWDHFWFGVDGAWNLACMRVVLVGTMFYTYLWRVSNLSYFNSDSILPREYSMKIFSEFGRPWLSWCFWPDTWAGSVHWIYLGLLFLIFVGLSNRLLMVFCWILHMGFIHRNYAVVFGADIISGIFLFYLSFTKCCEELTFKKYLPTCLGSKKKMNPDMISSVFYRLMQIQICAIYAYTGFEKLKGGSWWDGTALWTVLANPQMAAFDMAWTQHFSLFILAGSFLTIIFEIYFPVMAINPRVRPYWLTAGVLFHLSIGILMGLMSFSAVMISTYFLFLKTDLKSRSVFTN